MLPPALSPAKKVLEKSAEAGMEFVPGFVTYEISDKHYYSTICDQPAAEN
jgi:hypothetical protein